MLILRHPPALFRSSLIVRAFDQRLVEITFDHEADTCDHLLREREQAGDLSKLAFHRTADGVLSLMSLNGFWNKERLDGQRIFWTVIFDDNEIDPHDPYHWAAERPLSRIDFVVRNHDIFLTYGLDPAICPSPMAAFIEEFWAAQKPYFYRRAREKHA